jgi:N-acetylglucosamine kinase-like BadF-type ATPase
MVFGADGGGTKTVGLLADEHARIIAERTAGATNANVVGVETAVENLAVLLRGCCEDARCSIADVRAIVLGLAGAGRKAVREEIGERLRERLHVRGRLVVETDARIALEGAFEGAAGIVVIVGTGSVVIGKGEDGTIAMMGGWGRMLGDEGSGYALGVEALKSVAAALDGRAPHTRLTGLVVNELKRTTREDILALVYQDGFDPAGLAPLVLDAASQGDDAARALLERGASDLAAQAHALALKLSLSGRIPIALWGGLVQQENVYKQMLSRRLREVIAHAELCSPRHSPAVGAVVMALQLEGLGVPTTFSITNQR